MTFTLSDRSNQQPDKGIIVCHQTISPILVSQFLKNKVSEKHQKHSHLPSQQLQTQLNLNPFTFLFMKNICLNSSGSVNITLLDDLRPEETLSRGSCLFLLPSKLLINSSRMTSLNNTTSNRNSMETLSFY